MPDPNEELTLHEEVGEEGQEGQGDEGSKEGEGGGEAPPAWQAAIDAIKAEQQDQNISVLAALASMQKPAAPTAPANNGGQAPEGIGPEAWGLAGQHPEIMGSLVSKEVEDRVQGEMGKLRSQWREEMQSQKAGDVLAGHIAQNYGDEWRDPNSPIVKAALTLKEQIAPFLGKDVRGTPQHDHIAFLLAAGASPGEVSKKHTVRAAAAQKGREEQIKRLIELTGGGTQPPAETKAPEINEEIAEKMDIDLSDPKVKARIQKRMAEYAQVDQGGLQHGGVQQLG